MYAFDAEKVKVGPIVYELCHAAGLTNGEQQADGAVRYGECEILIDAVLSKQSAVTTLLHEILHAILTHGGVQDQDEQTLELLSYGLYGFIKENPGLVKEIMDEEESKSIEEAKAHNEATQHKA